MFETTTWITKIPSKMLLPESAASFQRSKNPPTAAGFEENFVEMTWWQLPSVTRGKWCPNWKCYEKNNIFVQLARPSLIAEDANQVGDITQWFPASWILGASEKFDSKKTRIKLSAVHKQNAVRLGMAKQKQWWKKTKAIYTINWCRIWLFGTNTVSIKHFVASLSFQAGSSTTGVNLPNNRTIWFGMTWSTSKWQANHGLPDHHNDHHHSHNCSHPPKKW